MEKAATKKRGRRWRWVWRGAIVLVLMVVAVGLVPFLFTTAVARWALGRSAYGQFSPEIGAASFSLGGELVLRDVVVHELAPHADRVLVKVGQMRARFGWGDVLEGTLRDVDAAGVVVYLRAGDSDGGEAVTVMELLSSGDQPATRKGASVAKPFWMDHLECAGVMQVEGLERMGVEAGSWPFEVTLGMRGDRLVPTREVVFSVGGAEGGRASGRVVMEPTASGDRITVQQIMARQLSGTLVESVAKEMLKGWPKTFQQELTGQLASLDASGVIERSAGGATVRGRVDVAGIDVSSKADAKSPFELKGLAFGGDFEGPLSAEFLKSGAAKNGTLGVASLSYGKNRVERFAATWGVQNGVLEATGVKLAFAKADLEGAIRFSLAERKLITAKMGVQHLDQAEVAHNMAPDRFDAEGTVSGTIDLAGGKEGAIVGTIVLTSDGPGRLQIKDQQTAEALAQKLDTGTAAGGGGVLPANFSTIVVAQLKDYPYKTGRIEVSAPDGLPVVTLNYQRESVKPGEPGYGVPATIGGQKVLANYTIQLPGVAIVLKGKTVQEILALAAGLEQQVAGEGAGK